MPKELALNPLALPPTQADTDAQLIALWLNRSNSPHTRRNYQRHAARFLAILAGPLTTVRLVDVQAYLHGISPRMSESGQRPSSAGTDHPGNPASGCPRPAGSVRMSSHFATNTRAYARAA